MVSATDIITYIGVPLAVLGVMPILYTFLAGLYARHRTRRIIRQSDLEAEASVRTRLMTGVVEADLPVFRLERHSRDDDRYWATLEKALPIDGASWSHFDWYRRKTNSVCCRLQSFDSMVLPEAGMLFSELVEYLLDRGARPSLQGIDALLREGVRTPVGTRLMEIGRGTTGVLTVAKPGERHSSLSLQLHWSEDFRRKESNSLPPSYIRVTFLSSTLEEAPSNAQHKIIIGIGANGVEDVSVEPEVDRSAEDCPDFGHLKPVQSSNTESRIWFASIIIAVFGFADKATFKFKPSVEVLFFAREGFIPLEWIDTKAFEDFERELPVFKRVEFSYNSQYKNNWKETFSPGLEERARRLHRDRVTLEQILGRLREARQREAERREAERREAAQREEAQRARGEEYLKSSSRHIYTGSTISGKNVHLGNIYNYRSDGEYVECIDMLGLLPICLQRLKWDQTEIQRIVFPDQDGADQDYSASISQEMLQSVAERILGEMIFDKEFARVVLSTLCESLKWFREEDYKGENGRRRWLEDPERSPSVICCAFILLILIGKRAGYLFSGEGLYQCVERWETVHIS
jgi:hypothetical protein